MNDNSPIIRIKEESFENNEFQISVSFPHVDSTEIPTSLPNPYDAKTDNLFERYFEHYISLPSNDVPFKEVHSKIEDYGEQLFQSIINGNNEIYRNYQNIIQDYAPESLIVEIVGKSSEFQAIYWESFKQPGKPALAECGVIFRRKNIKHSNTKAAVNESPTVNLLIVTARPNEDHDVSYRTIQRPLIELINRAKLKVKPYILRPGTFEAFVKHLDEVGAKHYHIIHFDLHGGLLDYESYLYCYTKAKKADFNHQLFETNLFKGTYALKELAEFEDKKAFLFFESDERGTAVAVEAGQLAEVLEQNQIPVVILNACQSAKQDKSANETSLGRVLIQKGLQLVLAMRYSVSVTAAQVMMEKLYKELYKGKEIEKAIALGRQELYRVKERSAAYNTKIELEDWLLPVVYQNAVPDFKLREFSDEEEEKFIEQRIIPTSIQQHLPYGFFGRDLDILKIEKSLLRKGNILLLQGMGGAGKTTLLKYLGNWWLQTGFVEKVFYFGYEAKAYTKTDILTQIAHEIYDSVSLEKWRLKKDFVQEQNIIEALKTNSYALILDNAESITGVNLAIKNTLNKDERVDLKQFIEKLNGGDSKIIIGSRSEETWLKKGTFENNKQLLGGLDKAAAANFADKILYDIGITKSIVNKDEEFEQLLKLLSGYPLALKAVLPNLKNKTSKAILKELGEGIGDLDKGNAQEKTESIIKCIEYSHSNLSEDAQKLLMCLSPFVGVVNLTPEVIKVYFNELNKNPLFENYPFDKISEVVGEAVRNGFMQKIETDLAINILKLQPVFTYFLKNKIVDESVECVLEEAFVIYCNEIGDSFYPYIKSKNSQEQQIGYFLSGLEFENLYKALFLQLKKLGSIIKLIILIKEILIKKQLHPQLLGVMNEVYGKMQLYGKEKLENKIGLELISVLDIIANAYFASNLFSKAKETWLECVFIFEQNRIAKKEFNIMRGMLYESLGNVFNQEKNYSSGKEYYQKALAIYDKPNNVYNKAGIYYNLGNVSNQENDYASAKEYYLKALDIYKKFNNVRDQAEVYQVLGIVSSEEKDYVSANKYFQKALAICKQFKDENKEAQIYHNLGIVLRGEKDYKSAKDYYLKALAIYEKFKDFHSQSKIYQNFGVVSNDVKDYNLSKDYYQKALTGYLEYKDIYSVIQLLGNVLNLTKEAEPKAFTQSLLDQTKNTFKDNPEILKALEIIQKEINKLEE